MINLYTLDKIQNANYDHRRTPNSPPNFKNKTNRDK